MGGNWVPDIQQPELDFLEAQLVQVDTAVTLETLQAHMSTQFGVLYLITSIWHSITQKLQYRLKHMHLMLQNYNDNLCIHTCCAWCTQFLQEGLSLMDCVYVDESGFNLHQICMLKYACKGQHAIQVCPNCKGKNTSLVIAAAKEGIIAYDFKLGAYNSASFSAFIADVLIPALQHMGMCNKVIIMDNCRLHYNVSVHAAIGAAGHQLHFLPAYSPFLNAAEWVFAHIKPQMHKNRFNTWEYMVMRMQGEIKRITPEKTSGWIREVCRNALEALQSRPLGFMYAAQTYQEIRST
ncbi:related to transposase [Sporisorium scitamineum]|uniref:Related to transposase n=1 Tax=Sporisorium scitamineum TaxID=49012 RepID=A0A140KMV2_9BASI|nr:related to transposase [Sporisorium scitamineum]